MEFYVLLVLGLVWLCLTLCMLGGLVFMMAGIFVMPIIGSSNSMSVEDKHLAFLDDEEGGFMIALSFIGAIISTFFFLVSSSSNLNPVTLGAALIGSLIVFFPFASAIYWTEVVVSLLCKKAPRLTVVEVLFYLSLQIVVTNILFKIGPHDSLIGFVTFVVAYYLLIAAGGMPVAILRRLSGHYRLGGRTSSRLTLA